MKYFLSIPNAGSKFIEIEMHVDNISADNIYFQLPSWRPGRYELGNFAKNIQKWEAFDEKGNILNYKKITKDKWEVETQNISKVVVRYNYFASQLDAGSCWIDYTQLYVNPIHCFLFVEKRKNDSCEVALSIPDNWEVAGNAVKNKKSLVFKNYDELVDSPFIASPNLKHHVYLANKIKFHIWIQGECNPDFNRIENDFTNFTDKQIKMMGDFPSAEYHYLIQVLPYNFYHGVEHSFSTVLAIGPGYSLMNESIYPELIGLASHELFHTWNVKQIRPVEMLPYDYSKENYSRLGYVYEGFTTYYGDLFLARTGFFSLKKYLHEISLQLQKHMDNHGRFNYAVKQSSFDTWLDGYVPGIPDRKTSIYTEGSFIAMMLDIMIRKFTSGNKSLDDVMRMLYNDFAKKNIGYTETDIITVSEKVSGRFFKDFFNEYVNKPVSYDSLLEELLAFAGLKIQKTQSDKSYEWKYGFRIEIINNISKVSSVVPGSPAAFSGLSKDDEIIAVNNYKVEKNLNDLSSYFETEEISMHVFSLKKLKTVTLKGENKSFFNQYRIVEMPKPGKDQVEFLNQWLHLNH
jgi:predicted metalloprotease with PDZ domain